MGRVGEGEEEEQEAWCSFFRPGGRQRCRRDERAPCFLPAWKKECGVCVRVGFPFSWAKTAERPLGAAASPVSPRSVDVRPPPAEKLQCACGVVGRRRPSRPALLLGCLLRSA